MYVYIYIYIEREREIGTKATAIRMGGSVSWAVRVDDSFA